MMDHRPYERNQPTWQKTLYYVACYLLWFAYGALSLWTVLQYRDALLLLLPVIGPWIMGALDKFGLLLFGLIALIWILYLEHYLRTGVEVGRFWNRAIRAGVIQIAILALAYAFQWIAMLF